jgi:hypothetical protein
MDSLSASEGKNNWKQELKGSYCAIDFPDLQVQHRSYWALIRESNEMAYRVQALAISMRWKTRILETESGPFGKDKLLSCQKPLWHN